MINTNQFGYEDTEETDGRFTIDSSNDDPGVFFNMPMGNQGFQNNDNSTMKTNYGGFSTSSFTSQNNQSQFTYSSASASSGFGAGANPAADCSGNCGACMWSFLCKSAGSKLTSLGGGFMPKLG